MKRQRYTNSPYINTKSGEILRMIYNMNCHELDTNFQKQ